MKYLLNKETTLVTLGTVSLYPYAFNLEFWDDPRITIETLWPVEKNSREKISLLSKKSSVFVVMKFNAYDEHTNFLHELHLQKILQEDKPHSNYPILLAIPEQSFHKNK